MNVQMYRLGTDYSVLRDAIISGALRSSGGKQTWERQCLLRLWLGQWLGVNTIRVQKIHHCSGHYATNQYNEMSTHTYRYTYRERGRRLSSRFERVMFSDYIPLRLVRSRECTATCTTREYITGSSAYVYTSMTEIRECLGYNNWTRTYVYMFPFT